MHPRDIAAQECEARARQLGAGFEIHAQRGSDIGMLLGRESEVALRAPAVQFDIVRFVRALGHILCRQIGKDGEQVLQFFPGSVFRFFPFGHRSLDFGDLGLECLGLLLVALAHRLADGLGRFVAAALRLLDPGRGLALLGVECDDAVGLRFQPAAGKCRVECGGVGADKGDVVHGPRLCLFAPRLARHFGRVPCPFAGTSLGLDRSGANPRA